MLALIVAVVGFVCSARSFLITLIIWCVGGVSIYLLWLFACLIVSIAVDIKYIRNKLFKMPINNFWITDNSKDNYGDDDDPTVAPSDSAIDPSVFQG